MESGCGVLLNDRLTPDMQSFIYQVQSACDYVKAAEAPRRYDMMASSAGAADGRTEPYTLECLGLF
jgi:hypothetical protein